MTKRKPHEARETWLKAAAVELYAGLFAEAGVPTPPKYRVSCGWPHRSSTAIGQCFPSAMSLDSTAEIFISPELDDAEQVSHVLIHEMVHASDDCLNGHRRAFAKWARAVGLEGKLTATTPGPQLASLIEVLIKRLGPYPHAGLQKGARVKKKQTTRMLKIECDECGFTARASNKWVEALPLPATCPICEEKALMDSRLIEAMGNEKLGEAA